MNTNKITTVNWSNQHSENLYRSHWPEAPEAAELYDSGQQCGGCSFFAPFNDDYGLCCQSESRHFMETVFEHFTCVSIVGCDWGSHNFRKSPEVAYVENISDGDSKNPN